MLFATNRFLLTSSNHQGLVVIFFFLVKKSYMSVDIRVRVLALTITELFLFRKHRVPGGGVQINITENCEWCQWVTDS